MCESIVVVGAALSADVDAPTERVHSVPGARRGQSHREEVLMTAEEWKAATIETVWQWRRQRMATTTSQSVAKLAGLAREYEYVAVELAIAPGNSTCPVAWRAAVPSLANQSTLRRDTFCSDPDSLLARSLKPRLLRATLRPLVNMASAPLVRD